VESIKRLGCKRVILDGEIVALDTRGWPSFQILQNLGSDNRNVFFYAFDMLNLEGRETRNLQIEERKMLFGALGVGPASLVQVVTGLEADSRALLGVVTQHHLEGVIAKKAGSVYEAGQRSGTWIKYKNLQEQEFVIGGYTEPEGTRQSFGALLVGVYEEGELRFASKVGTGFTSRLLSELYKMFQPLKQKECPFVNLPETSSGRWGQRLTQAQMRTVTWLKPKLVCQIGFTEWTEGYHLRHPTFKGMRDDKSAKEVAREKAA
jgi:bifunctional non-homologous end joining protein LigD